MVGSEWVIDGLPDEYLQHLRTYVKDVQRVYGDSLDGVLLYGSAVRGEFLPGRSNLNIVLLVKSTKADQLKNYGALHRRWAKEQIVVPLFVTQADLPAMSLVFPLEYIELQEQHRLLAGQDPFVGFKVNQRHLLAEVLQSLRGNLLRVRQRFIEGGGSEEAVTILLPLSLTAILPCLRGVQRLVGRPVLSQGEPLLKDFETFLSVDLSGLRDAWLLKRGQISPGQKEIPRLMERYLESFERLVQSVEARLTQEPT